MVLNRIDVVCRECGQYLYVGEPPIKENPMCDTCSISTLAAQLEKLEGDYDTALQWNIELEEQLASARAALEKYGKHADDCHYEEVEGTIDGTIPIKHQIRPCTCGLEQALKG
jgi:hypothetical protein